ncbi:MAG TPA: family 16 glycoside hydrolase [Ktedonobacteraceae bacterium]|nr:family 16 glycoside hydrolase [Ktedonobacteraceae bacterium]
MNIESNILIVLGDFVVFVVLAGIVWRFRRTRSSLWWRIVLGAMFIVVIAASASLSFIYWSRPSEAMPLDKAALMRRYAEATNGNPVLFDTLKAQDKNDWDTGTWHHGDSCSFHDGAYHIKSVEQEYYSWCIAEIPVFRDFAYQVQMKIMEGDGGGLVFRSEGKVGNYYYFHVGQDGSYGLSIFVAKGQPIDVVKGTSTSIKTGLGQANMLCVVVRGSDIAMYVNRQAVAEVIDTVYSSGQIGVVADEDSKTTDVAYTNAQVWAL